MKLVQLANAGNAIKKISETDLPLKILYKVSRQVEKIRPHIEFFEEHRNDILQKICGEPKNGKFFVPAEKKAEVNAAIQELLDVDVEEVAPITLEASEDFRLSCDDLKALEGIIEFNFENLKEEKEDGNQ